MSAFYWDIEDDTPSVEEIAAAVASGLLCSECSEPFEKPHGHPVACTFCFGKLPSSEIEERGIRLATHEESTAAAFKRRANKRKAK